MRRSGDGFVIAGDGQPRWGRYGAAGVLVRHVEGEHHWYFLALRSEYTHRGGTWAIPGGALDEGEAPLEGALREFAEEIGHTLPDHTVAHVHEADHGGWSYWTVIVDVPERFPLPERLQWETADCRWVHAEELHQLELFDAFAATLTELGIFSACN
jgi:8-oxo-dGTP pyrophosphatase MutT (NUDIX family)